MSTKGELVEILRFTHFSRVFLLSRHCRHSDDTSKKEVEVKNGEGKNNVWWMPEGLHLPSE